MTKFPNLERDVENSPRFLLNEHGTYWFHSFSIGERGTWLDPPLVREVLKGLVKTISPHVDDADYIVCMEPGGNQWGLLVCHKLGLPLRVVRQQSSGLEGEKKVTHFHQLYGERDLYFSGFKRGEKAILFDDIISTAGTLKLVFNQLRYRRVNVTRILCILTKGDAYRKFEKKVGVRIDSLLRLNKEGSLISDSEDG